MGGMGGGFVRRWRSCMRRRSCMVRRHAPPSVRHCVLCHPCAITPIIVCRRRCVPPPSSVVHCYRVSPFIRCRRLLSSFVPPLSVPVVIVRCRPTAPASVVRRRLPSPCAAAIVVRCCRRRALLPSSRAAVIVVVDPLPLAVVIASCRTRWPWSSCADIVFRSAEWRGRDGVVRTVKGGRWGHGGGCQPP